MTHCWLIDKISYGRYQALCILRDIWGSQGSDWSLLPSIKWCCMIC